MISDITVTFYAGMWHVELNLSEGGRRSVSTTGPATSSTTCSSST